MIDPRSDTLTGVLDQVAMETPKSPAIFYGGGALSYEEVRNESRRVAKGLLAVGVRRGDRVGVLLGNQPEWLIGAYGAAYVGAVTVPLNTWYKRNEIEWTLRHAGVVALIAATSFLKQDFAAMLDLIAPKLTQLQTLILVGQTPGAFGWDDLIRCGHSVSEAQLNDAHALVGPDSLAFVLYTSGSTAEPKGVLLRHGGVTANGRQIGTRRDVVAADRIWLGSPLFYGLGATNALPVALTHGAALVLHDYFEPARAIQAIASTDATVWYGTGNMARAIMEHPSFTRRKVATLHKGNAGIGAANKRLTLVEMGITGATQAYGLTE